MNKQEWRNFKRNNIEQVWWWTTNEWVRELLNFPLIYTLYKFKWGKKIHRNLLKLRFFIKKKPIMPIMEYMVTTRCTLQCKHCNSFMPKFTDKTHIKLARFEDFKSDIDKVLKSVDCIEFIGFVGGEPMLCNDLAKMIDYACKQRKIHQVFLATNGTILPDKNMIKVMKNKKFGVQLSDYSHVKNIKTGVTVKFNDYKDMLKENNIICNSYQEKRDAVTWFTMPQIYKDEQDGNKMRQQYYNCVQSCNVICDGKILPCTAAPYIYKNLELTEKVQNEIIDLRKNISPKDLTKEIIEDFSRPNPAFCHYCHFENIQYGLPCGEQVEEGDEIRIGKP